MAKQILVVDDNPVVLKLVSEVLKKKGHLVKTAEDGLIAVNILDGYIPDIIFVDLLIPKINGEMLCKFIRSKPHLDNTYVIIFSGIATEVGVDLNNLGADAYIAKGKNSTDHIQTVLEKIENKTLRQNQTMKYGFEDVISRDATVGLLNYKKHLEVIIDNLSDGLIELTPEGIILFANPAAETLLSTAEQQLLGKNFFTFFQKEYHEYFLKMLENAPQGHREMSESKAMPLKERFVTLKVFSIKDGPHTICIVLIHDVTERKKLNEKLKLLSRTDLLTGTYNRRAFDEFFVKEINFVRRYKEPFSIILIDIDNFKSINDSLGHNVGDNILKESAKVFNMQIRQVDYLFRWGGDEFVILLPKTDTEGAQIIAERIRSAIETYKFPGPTSVTVSLGVSLFQLNDDVHTLIKRADDAVYQSKTDGRNRISILLP